MKKYKVESEVPGHLIQGIEKPENSLFVNMNEVIGKKDILMICLDTLRYDVAIEEEKAGRTPVLNSYGNKWEKRHAPGNFTYPSLFSIFAGFFPTPALPNSTHQHEYLFFPKGMGTGNQTPEGSFCFKGATFVEGLFAEDYETICIGGVAFFSKRGDIGKVFPSYFNKSYWRTSFGCTNERSAENQINFAIEKLENYPPEKRVFMFINFTAIHYPNKYFIPVKKEDDIETHAAALRYIDSQLPKLFDSFQNRADTLVIALSDHGTCYGEDGYYFHCLSHEVVNTVPYKHFILPKRK